MMRVAIVGRDAALWLSALALLRALAPAGVRVTAVELPSALEPAAVYLAQPSLEALHAQLGLTEAALLRACGGAYTLGQRFSGKEGTPFLWAWGTIGAPIDGEPFLPLWIKARHFGLDVALADFSATASAALQGRMLVPGETTAAFGRTDYGYHLPAAAYVAELKESAARAGVEMTSTNGVTVERARDAVQSLQLDNGAEITADLFIDATGTATLLDDAQEQASNVVADRILRARAAGFAAPPSFTELRAGPTGWTRLHPVQGATLVEHVFASDLTSNEEALTAATAAVGAPLQEVSIAALSRASNDPAWRGNCVTIGGPVDPMHGLELSVIQLGLVHLLSLFPAGPDWSAEQAEYNRITASAFARLRDFQAAVHALAPWQGRFWDRARAAQINPELTHKIATFRARGEVTPLEDESVSNDDWAQLLVGLGVMPESWPPAVDLIDGEAMKAGFRGHLRAVRDIVMTQPSHRDYLGAVMRGQA